jgi:hypothetical protein
VTRDTDYGAKYNGQPYLNDWLRQEFHQRVGARRKIILTDRLSTAFRLVEIPVTPDMVKEEDHLLLGSDKASINAQRFWTFFRQSEGSPAIILDEPEYHFKFESLIEGRYQTETNDDQEPGRGVKSKGSKNEEASDNNK